MTHGGRPSGKAPAQPKSARRAPASPGRRRALRTIGGGLLLAVLGGRAPAAPARRLLAIGPGALRLLTYLGATDLLVGLEDLERRPLSAATYRLALPPGLARLPAAGPGGPGKLPELELVLGLRPDLIATVALDGQQLRSLTERAGIPVLPLSYGDTGILCEADFADSLRALGQAVGREARAATLIELFAGSLADLGRRVAPTPAPKPAAYVGGVSMQGTHGIGSTQSGHRPLAWAGADNLADRAGPAGHLFLDREQLLAWDPPVLFVDGGGLPGIRTEYARDPDFYRRLQAVRTDRVYLLLPFNAYNTNVENALANAWAIAKVLHPEALAEVDVQALAGRIMTGFLGIDPMPALARNGYGLGRLDLASGRWTPL